MKKISFLEDDDDPSELEKMTRLPHSNSHFASQDVGSFLGGGVGGGGYQESPISNEAETEEDYDGTMIQTKGNMNFVMKLHNDPEMNIHGATVEMEKSDMKLFFYIPPKYGRRLFASCEGNTGFLGQRGFGTSVVSVGYRIWNGIGILYDWNTCDGLSKNAFGAYYKRKGSHTKIRLQFPPSVRASIEPIMISVNTCNSINDRIAAEVDMDVSTIDYGITNPWANLRIGLKTMHDDHMTMTLPHVRLYLDVFQRTPLNLSCRQTTMCKEDSSRQLSSCTELSLALGRGNQLQVKALLTQSLDKFTKFSIGVAHSSWEGLSWIFCWQKADLCLNIPIQIMPLATSYCNSLVYSMSTAYLSFWSYCIHLAIQELLSGVNHTVLKLETKHQDDDNDNLLLTEKAKEDAENQIKLMKRKADANRRSEESKCGLVIEKASYTIKGGECLDVTTALMFWVTDSKLALASSSFGHMLGFYDIRKKHQVQGADSGTGLYSLFKSWLLSDTTPKLDEDIPMLYIRYKFNSKTYKICVQDNQALVLPSPHAVEIKQSISN